MKIHSRILFLAMRASIALALLLLLAALPLAAQSVITPHDVAHMRLIGDAVISPDGAQIAYVLSVPRNPMVEDDGAAWAELHVIGADGIQRACTADMRLGLAIVVVNDRTGAQVCDAEVTARDGGYSETLHRGAGMSECVYVGVPERSGTYSVRAEAAGFSASTLQNVSVPMTEDGCHVQGVRREIRLLPMEQD